MLDSSWYISMEFPCSMILADNSLCGTLLGWAYFASNFFQQFFLSIPEYFAQNLAIFLIIKMFFLVYLQLLSMHDCCIRVIHNMVAALSLDIFLWAYIDLTLFMNILFEYFYLCYANMLSHNSQTAIFPNFTFPQNLFLAF